jgi:uncharacterized Tic20 family protein
VRTWSFAAHLSPLLLGPIGPLLVMLVQGPKSAAVRTEAVEALNFAITVTIAVFACLPLVFVLVGFLLLPVVGLAALAFAILAAVAVNERGTYRYPVALRLVS